MEVKAGVIGGTLVAVIFQMNVNQILSTALLAAIGAVVSFTVSSLLKILFKRIKNKI